LKTAAEILKLSESSLEVSNNAELVQYALALQSHVKTLAKKSASDIPASGSGLTLSADQIEAKAQVPRKLTCAGIKK
jgi:hypothetical protein